MPLFTEKFLIVPKWRRSARVQAAFQTLKTARPLLVRLIRGGRSHSIDKYSMGLRTTDFYRYRTYAIGVIPEACPREGGERESRALKNGQILDSRCSLPST